MTTIPTLEMLAEQAEARGQVLGAKDSPSGQHISEADARKHIADLVLLYMIFIYEEGDDEEIYTDYIRSEFMLGYTFSFYHLFENFKDHLHKTLDKRQIER